MTGSHPTPATPDDTHVLITGTTSSLGLEAARQFAEAGHRKVTITGRTAERTDAAADRLRAETGRDVFEPLVIDLDDPSSVSAAGDELVARGDSIDVLVLNAGMVPGNDRVITDAGVEVTMSSSLVGHHQLTTSLIDADLLSDSAHIIIAGSEAARGDVPMFSPLDLSQVADASFDGDLQAAAGAALAGEVPKKFKSGDVYATAKVFVANWASALARRVPDTSTVLTVSPGSAPDTDAARQAPWYMTKILLPALKLAPKRMGMVGSVEQAAARYVDAAHFGPETSGAFYASPPKKMTGPLTAVDLPHFHDHDQQEAVFEATATAANRISAGV